MCRKLNLGVDNPSPLLLADHSLMSSVVAASADGLSGPKLTAGRDAQLAISQQGAIGVGIGREEPAAHAVSTSSVSILQQEQMGVEQMQALSSRIGILQPKVGGSAQQRQATTALSASLGGSVMSGWDRGSSLQQQQQQQSRGVVGTQQSERKEVDAKGDSTSANTSNGKGERSAGEGIRCLMFVFLVISSLTSAGLGHFGTLGINWNQGLVNNHHPHHYQQQQQQQQQQLPKHTPFSLLPLSSDSPSLSSPPPPLSSYKLSDSVAEVHSSADPSNPLLPTPSLPSQSHQRVDNGDDLGENLLIQHIENFAESAH